MTTHLLLIRHGQTEWNRDRRIQGNGDSPLTDLGQAQAEAAAKALSRFDVAALYASDAGRALQTALPIANAAGLTVQTDARLRERHYGIFEGKTHAELRQECPDVHFEYLKRHPDFIVPGGESLAQLQARTIAACTDIAQTQPDKHVAIVAHGGTIRAFARYALAIPLNVVWRAQIENGGLSVACYENGADESWSMITLNEVAHLP